MNRPSLLYVCPVIPALAGNGLAMRAGAVLEALAERYRLSLLTVPMFGEVDREISQCLREICANVVTIPYHADTVRRIQEAGAAYSASNFAIVHVFRLVTVQFAKPYLKNPGTKRFLDLDDIESKTHRRIAALCRATGNIAEADKEAAQAKRVELLEIAAFKMFDRIYVCSENDRRELSERTSREVVVLRNVIRLPEAVTDPGAQPPFRFLFLGTLGYYPNEDGIRYFCTEVLPLIRERALTQCTVEIVGAGKSGALQNLTDDTVRLIGAVPDVRPVYERCHAMIVPIRAAGGTRIKILEAFSYRRPVITTSIGAEGLDAVPGTHLLAADTPQDFADACLRVMSDPALVQALVENAHSLLLQSYTIRSLKAAVAAL